MALTEVLAPTIIKIKTLVSVAIISPHKSMHIYSQITNVWAGISRKLDLPEQAYPSNLCQLKPEGPLSHNESQVAIFNIAIIIEERYITFDVMKVQCQ